MEEYTEQVQGQRRTPAQAVVWSDFGTVTESALWGDPILM